MRSAPEVFPREPLPPPLGLLGSLLAFGGAGILLLLSTQLVIPAASEAAGLEPVVAWFLVAGGFVFTPMVVAGLLVLRRELGASRGRHVWAERLRFRTMLREDWLWALGALFGIGFLTGVVYAGLAVLVPDPDLHPPFMAFEPVSQGRYWILAAWLPFWVLNILGEEVVWRGVILPRQEVAFGRHAWMVNVVGWLLFHLAFGWQLMLILLPIVLVLPWVTQRTQNTWVAVVIHGGVNGPAFLAIALGLG